MKRFIAYKKSIPVCIGFLLLIAVAKGQDFTEIRNLLATKELAKAKHMADSAVAARQTAASLFLKAVVYDSLQKDPGAKYLTDDALWQSFLALKAATQIDKIYITKQAGSGNVLALDIYSSLTREGLNYFNTGVEGTDKSNFEKALTLLKKAAVVSNYLFEYGWRNNEVDTVNLYFSAKAAIASGQEQETLVYAKRIADYQFIYLPFKPGYALIYEWLVYYYKTKKEEELFQTYLITGRKIFPQSQYFNLVEADWLRESKNYTKLFTLYEQIIKEDKSNNGIKLKYCNDLINYIWGINKPAIKDKPAYMKELEAVLGNIIQSNNDPDMVINAKILLAKVYINQATDAINETRPAKNGTNRFIQFIRRSNGLLIQIINATQIKQQKAYLTALELLIKNAQAIGDNVQAKKYELLLRAEIK
jgi:hypothetical protein